MKVPDRPTQIGIWIYFWLLFLEGVLRKWIFPQWSDILFVIRDPVVIAIYILAIRARVFPFRPAMVLIWILATSSLVTGISGDSPFVVTVFGIRTDFLHLPLIFVMESVFYRSDVVRFGLWMLLLSVPIVLLMIAQFNAPRTAWVNVGVAANSSGQLFGAEDHIRAPGPFSFISSTVSYGALAAAFALYGWIERRAYPLWLVLIATGMLALCVPVSISRSLLMSFLIVAMFGVAALVPDFHRAKRLVKPAMAALLMIGLFANTDYVHAFVVRWDEASMGGEGGFYVNVILRILNVYIEPFKLAMDAPFWGYGIGLGTIGGARLAVGQTTFLLAESELDRIVLELGPLLGFAFIGWRVWLAGSMIWRSWIGIVAERDMLAWLITGASFMSVISGQWGPATQLGFAVFGAGLALAALNPPASEPDDVQADAAEL